MVERIFGDVTSSDNVKNAMIDYGTHLVEIESAAEIDIIVPNVTETTDEHDHLPVLRYAHRLITPTRGNNNVETILSPGKKYPILTLTDRFTDTFLLNEDVAGATTTSYRHYNNRKAINHRCRHSVVYIGTVADFLTKLVAMAARLSSVQLPMTLAKGREGGEGEGDKVVSAPGIDTDYINATSGPPIHINERPVKGRQQSSDSSDDTLSDRDPTSWRIYGDILKIFRSIASISLNHSDRTHGVLACSYARALIYSTMELRATYKYNKPSPLPTTSHAVPGTTIDIVNTTTANFLNHLTRPIVAGGKGDITFDHLADCIMNAGWVHRLIYCFSLNDMLIIEYGVRLFILALWYKNYDALRYLEYRVTLTPERDIWPLITMSKMLPPIALWQICKMWSVRGRYQDVEDITSSSLRWAFDYEDARTAAYLILTMISGITEPLTPHNRPAANTATIDDRIRRTWPVSAGAITFNDSSSAARRRRSVHHRDYIRITRHKHHKIPTIYQLRLLFDLLYVYDDDDGVGDSNNHNRHVWYNTVHRVPENRRKRNQCRLSHWPAYIPIKRVTAFNTKRRLTPNITIPLPTTTTTTLPPTVFNTTDNTNSTTPHCCCSTNIMYRLYNACISPDDQTTNSSDTVPYTLAVLASPITSNNQEESSASHPPPPLSTTPEPPLLPPGTLYLVGSPILVLMNMVEIGSVRKGCCSVCRPWLILSAYVDARDFLISTIIKFDIDVGIDRDNNSEVCAATALLWKDNTVKHTRCVLRSRLFELTKMSLLLTRICDLVVDSIILDIFRVGQYRVLVEEAVVENDGRSATIVHQWSYLRLIYNSLVDVPVKRRGGHGDDDDNTRYKLISSAVIPVEAHVSSAILILIYSELIRKLNAHYTSTNPFVRELQDSFNSLLE